MTEPDFISFLARIEGEGVLTSDQSDALLVRFRAGEIADDALPLPLDEAIEQQLEAVTESRVDAALDAVEDLLRTQTAEDVRDGLQDAYNATVRGLAEDFAASGQVRKWHAGMCEAVIEHTLKQGVLGLVKGAV